MSKVYKPDIHVYRNELLGEYYDRGSFESKKKSEA